MENPTDDQEQEPPARPGVGPNSSFTTLHPGWDPPPGSDMGVLSRQEMENKGWFTTGQDGDQQPLLPELGSTDTPRLPFFDPARFGLGDSDGASSEQTPAAVDSSFNATHRVCCTHDMFHPGDAQNARLASVQEVGHRRALLHRFARVMFEITSHNPQYLAGVKDQPKDRAITNALKLCASELTRPNVLIEIPERLDSAIKLLREKFMEYHQDRVPTLLRDGYADAHVMKAFWKLRTVPPKLPDEEAMAYMVTHLDKSLIVAGPSAGTFDEGWIEKTIDMMKAWEESEASHITETVETASQSTQQALETMGRDEPPSETSTRPIGGTFSKAEPFGRPELSPDHECPRQSEWSVSDFEDYMRLPPHPRPVIFTDQMRIWPALTKRPWTKRAYFLSHTFHGRRLVPVEIGRTYVDDGWGQELMPFGDFMQKFIDPPNRADHDPTTIGYMAQHDLFRQMPKLRNDVLIPDLCWADVPGHPVNPNLNKPRLDMPQLNAWFGPARTITPLHTDGYHNLLCQVVGKKYVRLYPPWTDNEVIRPKGLEEGIDMSNTSELDLGVIEGWDQPPEDLDQIEIDAVRDDLKSVEYWECILEEGETLLIPMGWWHYVRSLSVSFSVSFWWN